MSEFDKADLEFKLDKHKHVLHFWDELSDMEKKHLALQINKIDVKGLEYGLLKAFIRNDNPQKALKDIAPLDPKCILIRDNLTNDRRDKLYNLGLKAISQGKLAVIVLAGGQASRLGSKKPKGTLKLGANIGELDSLFFIQALQIMRLKQLAQEAFPNSKPSICWLVMCSQSTAEATKEHMNMIKKITNMDDSDIIMFTQDEIPCFDTDGKYFMKNKYTIATAPDGNGGFYRAFQPIIPVMEKRRIEYFHVYCVDNILCKVADPIFLGGAIDFEADVCCKVVEKEYPEQAVGHICKAKNLIKVVEYSEITKELAEERDETGKLKYRHGSIANHFFTLTFLKSVCTPIFVLPYHIAKKKIPHLDLETGEHVEPTEPNGYKLEQFIFDSFQFCRRFMMYQVSPKYEFSPLKNADSVGKDCPATCVRDLIAASKTQPEFQWIFENYSTTKPI